MNISEASAVNTVLDYFLGLPRGVAGVPSKEQAIDAAVLLADRADKALSAGIRADDVRGAWPE